MSSKPLDRKQKIGFGTSWSIFKPLEKEPDQFFDKLFENIIIVFKISITENILNFLTVLQ